MDELKPCICVTDGEVTVAEVVTPDFTLLFCPKCDRKIKKPTKEAAIAAWNGRTA